MNLIHDSQKKSLRKAIAEGENDRVEFKAGFDRETIQSLVAFANTRGGCVIVGVDDQGTENDKAIAVLSIQEYPVKPVSCKGRYFKRIKNSNHQMSISEISLPAMFNGKRDGNSRWKQYGRLL